MSTFTVRRNLAVLLTLVALVITALVPARASASTQLWASASNGLDKDSRYDIPLQVEAAGELVVQAEWNGPGRVELALRDPAGTVVGTATGRTSPARIAHEVTAGTWSLGVDGSK